MSDPPERDVLDQAVEEADGSRRVYQSRPRLDRLRTWVDAHPILSLAALAVGVGLISLAWVSGWLPAVIEAIPPWTGTAAYYLAEGLILTALPAYAVVRWIWSPRGVHVLDLDPVGRRHRHLRVGKDVWDQVKVKTAWGEDVTKETLQDVSLNGERGYEVMDFRVPEDGRPVCVATWMGEADAARLRTYARAVEYARKRLTKRAERALTVEANREAIVREVAEKVVVQMIRTSERSGVPHGEEIEGVVDDVLADFGVSRTQLADDLREDRHNDLLGDDRGNVEDAEDVEEVGNGTSGDVEEKLQQAVDEGRVQWEELRGD